MNGLKSTIPGSDGIELAGVTKRFLTPSGKAFTALREVSLTVAPGQFCAVVGPTGCGKSTTLTLVAGLEPPSAGTVRVAGQPVAGIPDGIGFVFQADALLP
ncbi:MAG: ATP-binding cassette domain-containing protein, partial [Nocardiopsaceae bacterium]|nr:ATP-binding cassette domain-containing protein [Nocardiopsaceae bacterium]